LTVVITFPLPGQTTLTSPYKHDFVAADWQGAGPFTIAISVGTHNQGLAPPAQVWEDTGGTFMKHSSDVLADASGNITLSLTDVPFDGYALIG